MTRLSMIAGLALALVGCASPSSYERRAQTHAERADRAAAVGDYQTAAREQNEARRLRLKARGQAVNAYPAAPTLPPGGAPPFGP